MTDGERGPGPVAGEELQRFEHRGQRIVVRTYQEGDADGLIDCYNSVFPVDDPSQLPQTRRLWDWKFDPSLAGGGREIVVAEHADAGIIGAYPCQPLRVWLDGEPRRTSQIVDLMVRHDWRRVGPRPGLFVTLGRAFYARYCGRGEGLQPFNYGWPVPAWRVGQRYLDYQNVRDWNLLVREIEVERPADRVDPAGLQTTELNELPAAEIDALWGEVRSRFRLTLVRDSGWFGWRYRDHPERSYRFVACRESGPGSRLRGMAVYSVGDFLRPDTSFLVDLLVAPDDHDALRALVFACERLGRIDETGVLAMVLSPTDPRFLAAQRLGYLLWDSHYFLVAATFGIDALWLRDHWSFTMGDSDLI